MKNDLSRQKQAIVRSEIREDIKPNLSLVIPAFNTGPIISSLLDSILELARIYEWEVIVVDDGSTDDTARQVEQCDDGHYVKLIRHTSNRGYGAAVKTGIRASNANLIATIDSDGQHDPKDLLKILPYAEMYNLVVGQRSGIIHSRLWRMPGKWVLNWLANYVNRLKIPDLNSGMRLFHADVVSKYLHLCSDGFSFSTTSTLIFFNRGYAVHYVPITIRQPHKDVKSTVKLNDGFETLVLILRIASLFNPLRVFIPASCFSLVAGILWGLPYVFISRGISIGALLLILTGFLLFFFGLLTDQVAQMRLEKYE